jgi:hypothetical protein
MSKVSREKYEQLKYNMGILNEKYINLQKNLKMVEILEDKIQDCEKENDNLLEENRDLIEQLDRVRQQIKGYKVNVQDTELLNELENENKIFRKTIRDIKKDNKIILEKNEDKVRVLERDIMLKDGKIQRLEDGYMDLKERYKELKDEIREEKRWIRSKNKNDI